MEKEKMEKEKILKALIEKKLERSVDTACWIFVYQPKLPKGIEKFKR